MDDAAARAPLRAPRRSGGAIGSASSSGSGPCAMPIGERRPVDELQHERRARRSAVLEAVDRGDVRMVQRGQHLRFALEARQRDPDRARTTSGSTLIATSRPSFVSRARYTSPMPPAPSADRTSYGPSRCQWKDSYRAKAAHYKGWRVENAHAVSRVIRVIRGLVDPWLSVTATCCGPDSAAAFSGRMTRLTPEFSLRG